MKTKQVKVGRCLGGVILLAMALGMPPTSSIAQDNATKAGESSAGSARTVKIGVLAKRGPEKCMERWTPTAKYLTKEIPGHSFEIVPLGYNEVIPAIRSSRIDIVFCNSSIYVEAETLYGARRGATVKNLSAGRVSTTYGGVIFCRADRDDIKSLSDLKGKTFMAVSEQSLGGWLAGWREMKEKGIDPHRDFKELLFGGTHDAVVYAVRDGKVDAGTVRTDTLERMQAEGNIRIRDFHIIHDEHGRGNECLPFRHSTRPYPEWPIAKTRHTSDELAEKVAVALLIMPADSPAAKAAKYAGWTIPHNYQPVRECLMELHVGPYKGYEKAFSGQLIRKFWYRMVVIAAALAVMSAVTIYVLRLNRRLNQTQSGMQRELNERQQAELRLQQAHSEMEQLFAAIPSILIGLSADRKVIRWNKGAEHILGISPSLALDRLIEDCGVSWERERIAGGLSRCAERRRIVTLEEVRFTRPDGKEAFLGLTMTPFGINGDRNSGILILGADVTERKIMQSQLAQAQKLESIGQLAAGIAHEINTPTQYVGDNTRFLADSFGDILKLLKMYESLLTSTQDADLDSALLADIRAVAKKIDIEYLREEIPEAIRQSLEGIERVTKIVRAMKDFSHPNVEEKTAVDINREIQTTITVARNEWKYVAEMKTDFDQSLPPVECLPGEFDQVILNMITNAAHTIGEVVGDGYESKGTITISTRQDEETVEIRVSDTGAGIPEEIQTKIFDPFFTTKEVGKGTGQGLTISRSVIVDKHGGTLSCETEMGKGTTFIIRIPIESAAVEESSRAA